jgi:hypothetical protein
VCGHQERSRDVNWWDVASTNHHHLVPRLAISAAIPLLPFSAFMAGYRVNFDFLPSSKYFQNIFLPIKFGCRIWFLAMLMYFL